MFEDEDGRFVAMRVEVSRDAEAEPILSRPMLDELNRGLDHPMKWGIQSSGTQIPVAVAERLEGAWRDFCQGRALSSDASATTEALTVPSTRTSAMVAEKHFVSYHNADRMGYAFEDAAPFTVATSKSVKGTVGERVWTVSGEGQPRQYYLRDTWIVAGVGESGQDGFANSVHGDGVIFDPPIALSGLPWFPAFLKSQSNFSLGFLQIKNDYVSHFEQLSAAHLPPLSISHDHDLSPPERRNASGTYIVRDIRLANHVKTLHNHECQLCGYTIVLPDQSRYAEGHHIQPLGTPHDGPDTSDNILCLCPNHHTACDYGAIPLVAADLRHVGGHVVGQRFLDYHNRRIYSETPPEPVAKGLL